MEPHSKNSVSSTPLPAQNELLNPDTPIGVINITMYTLINALITVGWPVNSAIDFGCVVGEESIKVIAAMLERSIEAKGVH